MEEQKKRHPAKPWRWVLGGAVTVFVLAALAWVALFVVNQFVLSLCLTGEQEIILEYGEAYTEPGAVVMVHGTVFWKDGFLLPEAKIETATDLNEETLGRYAITYRASYGDWTEEAQRRVCIVDTVAPVIILDEDPEGELLKEEAFRTSGYTATDNYDGDITDQVRCVVTEGLVTYSVLDSSGNPAYAERELPTNDFLSPEILLKGGSEMSIIVGEYLFDPGYTATDNWDGDLTEQVKVEGEIKWLIPGEYQATYSVTDAAGNTASVTRKVTVNAQPRPEVQRPYGKVIYLTFDDGPGPYTMQLLDILDRNGVKATFFVTDSEYGYVMKEIVDRGHSIGIHTVSHNYDDIYASPENYFTDVKRMQNIIYMNTGVHTTLLRFPGGSSNTVSYYSYRGLMTFLTEAVQDAGFQYFDWNVDSGDTGDAKDSMTVFENVTEGVGRQGVSAVLQHDIHDYSVAAVERIIQWGLRNGYTFLPLTETSPGFHHGVRN